MWGLGSGNSYSVSVGEGLSLPALYCEIPSYRVQMYSQSKSLNPRRQWKFWGLENTSMSTSSVSGNNYNDYSILKQTNDEIKYHDIRSSHFRFIMITQARSNIFSWDQEHDVDIDLLY